jgi:hypothetical protein
MTVKDFFENFEDKGGSVIRIVADNGNFDTRIGYNYIDKKHSMWRNFIAMYGDYIVTEWCVDNIADTSDIYKVVSVYIEKSKDEGKFDYNIFYNISTLDNRLKGGCKVVCKSQLSDEIENIFLRGGYDVKISCLEK